MQSPVFADSIIFPNGNVLIGKIRYILSGIIEIKTKDGTKKITREVGINQARDIIETGFFHKKKFSGEVYFLDDDFVEMKTLSGNLKIRRLWLRNVILSQETGSMR